MASAVSSCLRALVSEVAEESEAAAASMVREAASMVSAADSIGVEP